VRQLKPETPAHASRPADLHGAATRSKSYFESICAAWALLMPIDPHAAHQSGMPTSWLMDAECFRGAAGFL